MKFSKKNFQKRQKGEIMIVGTEQEISALAKSQRRYVGDRLDVNGAIACVKLTEIFKSLQVKGSRKVNGKNQVGDQCKYLLGWQCNYLWRGSKNRPQTWKDDILKNIKKNLDDLYVLCVFFKGNESLYDGNPFIGGTKEDDETGYEAGIRELGEEVGLGIIFSSSPECPAPPKISSLPHTAIYLVEAERVFDLGQTPGI